MHARQCKNDEQQFKLPPSLNTVSLRRISFFLEIHSPRSITPFFFKMPHFPLNQIKLPLWRSPSWLVLDNDHRFKEDQENGKMLKKMWEGDLTIEDRE